MHGWCEKEGGQCPRHFSHVSFFHPCSYYELEAEEYKRRGVNLTPELWLVG